MSANDAPEDLQHPGQLEVDSSENTDSDSAYGDEMYASDLHPSKSQGMLKDFSRSTYTATLATSVSNFREEYGRRYHAFRDGRYMLPNDDQESERLDIHHALMVLLLDGKLYLAPISAPQRVLDLGTGTGIWAIDFADQHPSAAVIGNDLSPIQPIDVPPNLSFYVDDFEDEWGYESQPFDFIHARYLASSVRDWPKLVRQAFNCTKPGGWVEFQDWDCMIKSMDNNLTKDHSLFKWHAIACPRRTAGGYDTQPGPKLEGWVKDAGFVKVGVHKLPIPLGTWPKDKRYKQIGAFNQLQLEQGLEGLTIGMLTQRTPTEDAWSMEEVQVLLAEVRQDLKNPKLHGQFDFYVVYGQKPNL